jgi:hypothetical protein
MPLTNDNCDRRGSKLPSQALKKPQQIALSALGSTSRAEHFEDGRCGNRIMVARTSKACGPQLETLSVDEYVHVHVHVSAGERATWNLIIQVR